MCYNNPIQYLGARKGQYLPYPALDHACGPFGRFSALAIIEYHIKLTLPSQACQPEITVSSSRGCPTTQQQLIGIAL